MMVMLAVLLGVSIALLVPLAADKMWKRNQDKRIPERADSGARPALQFGGSLAYPLIPAHALHTVTNSAALVPPAHEALRSSTGSVAVLVDGVLHHYMVLHVVLTEVSQKKQGARFCT